jgi:hypothetical protein
VRKPIASHSPPKWSNERAVLDVVTRWFGEQEHREAMEQAQWDDGGGDMLRVPTRRELAAMLRSGAPISPQDRALIANLLEREGVAAQPKRKRGRPKQPIEQRRATSILPDAEALFMAVVDFLKRRYPTEKVGEIRDRAIEWTVAKIKTYEVVGSEPLTKKKLRNYLARARSDRRRL